MKKSFVICLIIFLISMVTFGQNQNYIIHKIKSGESLYALTKKYKVSLDEIKKANPDLGAKIDIGTEVKIPKKGAKNNNTTSNKPKEKPNNNKAETKEPEEQQSADNQFIKHKLKAKESFAVLSRKYGVSIAEIKKANPNLPKTVKVGTVVIIPKTEEENNSNTTESSSKPQEPVVKATPEPSKTSDNNADDNASEEEFIIHKVKSKETLSSISKKYKKTIAQIKAINSGLEKGLKIGQSIKIPTGKKVKKPVDNINPNSQEFTSAPVEESSETNDEGYIIHRVKPRQTLFAIANQYKVTVNEIKDWNGLKGASKLKTGQPLKIKTKNTPEPAKQTVVARVEPKKEQPKEVVQPKENIQPKEIQPVNNGTEPDEPVKPSDEPKTPIALKEPEPQPEVDPDKIKVTTSTAVNASGYSKITETGLAEIMGENIESNKFLALHKTAPIGTLIQVKNPMNGVAIFVRIIGKLPDTAANDKIIIKVTKKVRERIGGYNNKFPVEISYIP